MALPLEGIRVLDLTQVMAGPFCTMLLGDMGADIIKIEPPGAGDQTRQAMGFKLKGDDSAGFLLLNRNKRSIAINLKSKDGQALLHDLVRRADVLVENGRPGVAATLGYDYPTLQQINRGLVYASISGFGQTGPWAQRPGFDLIAQAMSGTMSVTGHPGQAPTKNSIPAADLGSALFAVYGILSALIARQRSGEGQHIDASLFETALSMSIWEIAEYWGTGRLPQQIGSANRMSAPYQAVKASDGYFVFGAANQKLWLALCAVLSRTDLSSDPRFVNGRLRLANREELIEELEKSFATRTASDWVETLLAAGIPAGPIYDYGQALASAHAQQRDMIMEIEHPAEGPFRSLGFPVKMSGTPQQVRLPPPLLDQHREEILKEFGIDSKRIAQLASSGVFGS
jgi:crotonobetainyl-CoA:carnitine CoA-transferase CaiB-like acyl-CoA transferase